MSSSNEQQPKEGSFSFSNLKHRLSGLITHVFMARGWIKPSKEEGQYNLTNKGKKALGKK